MFSHFRLVPIVKGTDEAKLQRLKADKRKVEMEKEMLELKIPKLQKSQEDDDIESQEPEGLVETLAGTVALEDIYQEQDDLFYEELKDICCVGMNIAIIQMIILNQSRTGNV